MPESIGSISLNDNLIVGNIEIWYEIDENPSTGLKTWYGEFELPDMKYVELGTYTLKLANGKSGMIITDEITPTGITFEYHFTGSGPLK